MVGLALIAGGVAAGVVGSLLGLGGGILIVPLLTLGFGLPLREAVGASLVCVIVTSGASAGVYLERHIANLRLGMTLELFTALGALTGGLLAFALSERVLAGLFAVLLGYVAFVMVRQRDRPSPVATDLPIPPAEAQLEPTNRTESAMSRLAGPSYRPLRLRQGMAGSFFAGIVSALLGIGGGLIKVPVMNLVMGVPLRVATATSNLMIGVTASSSAIIYLLRGGIDPYVAGTTAVGVFIGATIGSRTAHRIDLRLLRLLFVVILAYTAFEMLRKALALQ